MVNEVQNLYAIQFGNFLKIPVSSNNYNELFEYGKYLIDEIYKYGILPVRFDYQGNQLVFLIKGKNEFTLNIDDFIRLENLKDKLSEYIIKSPFQEYSNSYYKLLFEIVQPNISIDEKLKTTSQKRVLHIANFNENADGRLYYSFANKLNNGFIKNT